MSRNPTTGAFIGEPRALAYTSRTAYISYAQVYHPPYAFDPYDRSRNVLQTPRIHTFCSHCLRLVTVYYYKQAVTYIVNLRYKSGIYRKEPVFKAQAFIEAYLIFKVTIKVLQCYLGGDYSRRPRQVSYKKLYFIYSLGYIRI